MQEFSTDVLFRPTASELRFLPEGPYPYGEGQLSWVSIQHGLGSTVGAINVFDFASGSNSTHGLPGRPGFAFPTDQESTFVVGCERHVGLFNIATGEWSPMSDELEAGVTGTILNDGVAFSGGLVFGAKDLTFSEKKAGLYLWRRSDREFVKLLSDQVCSNGKIVVGAGDQVTLLDIDTPTKSVVRYELDVSTGQLSEAEVVLDLNSREDFPDGMIATPDGSGVIIAFYNPHDRGVGQCVQFSLETGEPDAVWKTENAPRVTCPQLMTIDGSVKLVLTTAIEDMSAEMLDRHSNSGCLFVGETEFDSLPETPVFEVPGGADE
jgi:sugar lactone lactonase YvrE